MLKHEFVTSEHRDLASVRALYESSFPKDEKMDFDRLIEMEDASHHMMAWYDEDCLVGMTFVFLYEAVAYLAYFCIIESGRGRGYGTVVLDQMKSMYPRVVVDIEKVEEPNAIVKKRRKDFYLYHDFHETGIFYYIYHVDYELLCVGSSVTEEEWDSLIHAFWGGFADTAKIYTK